MPGDDGLWCTMTSAVRHPLHTCDNDAQSHRSAFARRSRRGWDRCSTLQLMAECEDLEVQGGTSSHGTSEGGQKRRQPGHHREPAYRWLSASWE